jgi:Ser/Thr protein kinase RdoA (MazF antagonist)
LIHEPDLRLLESLEGYRSHFMDPVFWAPYVKRVYQAHFSGEAEQIMPGFSGTYPTFIVNQRYVIKFFGRLFDGCKSWQVESACAQLLQANPVFPTPRCFDQGRLFPEEEPSWPYLIFEFIPGVRIAEALPHLTKAAKNTFTFWLGERVRALHRLTIPGSFSDILPSQQAYFALARQQCVHNHSAWRILPEDLIQQIPSFLAGCDEMDGGEMPSGLIHADLTRDHFLGEIQGGQWHTRAVIDFGDAMIGGLDYELVALHLDLFGLDINLLRSFLSGYGLEHAAAASLPNRALRATLLHPFNVLSILPENYLRHKAYKSLQELADAMWRLE